MARLEEDGKVKEMKKMAQTTTKKTAKQADYKAICAELGFDAAANFVKVTERGSISFTAGKPEEIRALAYAVRRHGYTAARQLLDAAAR